MKKIYYFSKEKLQFVEIKNFKYKLAATISAAVLLICLILFGAYSYIFSLINSDREVSSLKNENDILKEKLGEMSTLYTSLNKELENLVQSNKDLRVAADLPPISDDERQLGYGGGSFDNTLEFLKSPYAVEIKKASDLTEELIRKINFEKSSYEEITNKLDQNKKLYASMPGLKPCEGTLAYHGFGMRMHPIQNKVRMHEGIDIVTDIGTPVIAPGNGYVIFSGYKGSYGLTVEIDHGFGYKTLYAHLSGTLVKEGETVKRGEIIARTGTTGLSTGPHLHYEVEHNGIKQDPVNFIFDDMALFD